LQRISRAKTFSNRSCPKTSTGNQLFVDASFQLNPGEEMQGRSVLDEAIAGSGRVGDLHHELEALQREMSGP